MADPVTDEMLLSAIKQRFLRDMERKEQQAIVNNIYGGGAAPTPDPQENLYEQLAQVDPGTFDYFVDIERKDTPEGWSKKVHRYRAKQGAPVKKKRKQT